MEYNHVIEYILLITYTAIGTNETLLNRVASVYKTTLYTASLLLYLCDPYFRSNNARCALNECIKMNANNLCRHDNIQTIIIRQMYNTGTEILYIYGFMFKHSNTYLDFLVFNISHKFSL